VEISSDTFLYPKTLILTKEVIQIAKKRIKSVPTCSTSCHMGCYSGMLIVLGILVLLNATYSWFTWGVFIGGIIILKGIILMLHGKMCK
jgi:hypothetical protein